MHASSRENIIAMRPQGSPAVITMPSRDRAQRNSAVVVRMPSREPAEKPRAAVIEMPSRSGDAEEQSAQSNEDAVMRSDCLAGIRLTLVALFALLGWPRPTRDKDPGAAAARPWKMELTTLFSRLRLPLSNLAQHKHAAILEFPGSPAPDPPAAAVLGRLRAA